MSFFYVFNRLKLCDVTLTNINQVNKFSLSYKKHLLNKILYDNNPHKLEISLFQPPVNRTDKKGDAQKDALRLYQFTQQLLSKKQTTCQFYASIPLDKLSIDRAHALHIKNVSVLTAASDTYLQKYTNRPLQSTKNVLTNLFAADHRRFANVKLYVACVRHCPFEGTQKIQHIVRDILFYNTLPGINEICLVDTCGTLNYTDFRHIIEGLAAQMDISKLSLRLAVKKTLNDPRTLPQDHNVAQIIQFCIQNNIYKFDVISELEERACADTKATCKLLHYDTLYESIDDYAELAYYA
jgi:hypothetical protein